VRLWCAMPTSEKFIVQLSAVVIRQAGHAQNMFMSRGRRFSKVVGHFRRILDREGGIAHQPVLVSETRVIALPYVWYQNIRSASFSVVTIHASDRQTDGQNCQSISSTHFAHYSALNVPKVSRPTVAVSAVISRHYHVTFLNCNTQ